MKLTAGLDTEKLSFVQLCVTLLATPFGRTTLVCVMLGVRVVLLNCLDVFATRVMEQAGRLGMTQSGWAWILTDPDGVVQVESTHSYLLINNLMYSYCSVEFG